MEQNTRIEMIPIFQLEHHPKNPRRKIGDVTELADSIKASGIMQNLTIVPIPDNPKKYWVVIGNRRLEAAKIAGLEKLPCVISDMDAATQAATMLAENMQRRDLTVKEQLGGIQQCLDLGLTDIEVMRKTGLGRTAYRERKKLIEVQASGQSDIGTAMEKGYTIADYMQIGKLMGKKAIEECYELMESSLPVHEVRARISLKLDQEAHDLWVLSQWEPFAARIGATKETAIFAAYMYDETRGKMIKAFSSGDRLEEQKIPKLKKGEELKYKDSERSIKLYRVFAKRNDPQVTPESEEDQRKKLEYAVLKKRSADLGKVISDTSAIRLEWICMNLDKLKDSPSSLVLKGLALYKEALNATGIYVAGAWDDVRKKKEFSKILEAAEGNDEAAEYRLFKSNDETGLYWFAFWYASKHNSPEYQTPMMMEYNNTLRCALWSKIAADYAMERLFQPLKDLLGYEPTDVEKALLEGTHPLCRCDVTDEDIQIFKGAS